MKHFRISRAKWLLFLPLMLLCGCRAHYPVAQQSGKDDMAYLLLISEKQYAGKVVEVELDGQTHFPAQVVKASRASRSGRQYGIAPGNRKLKVISQNRVIYEKRIFVSTQEVKQIILP